jgi:ketosteroid isomerase-like protein
MKSPRFLHLLLLACTLHGILHGAGPDPLVAQSEPEAMSTAPNEAPSENGDVENGTADLPEAEHREALDALRAADQAYAAALVDRDRDAIQRLLASDAIFLERTPQRGRSEYLALMQPLFEQKYGFQVVYEPLEAHVARSGELGWTLGTSSTTFTRPGLEAQTFETHYMTVWSREADGPWQVKVHSTVIVHAEYGQAREPRTGLMTGWPQLNDFIDAAIELDWTPEHTVRAASGELAYTYGAYEVEFTRGEESYGGPGGYIAVWQKDEERQHWQLAAEGYSAPQIH